jgi:hypothetical protein
MKKRKCVEMKKKEYFYTSKFYNMLKIVDVV